MKSKLHLVLIFAFVAVVCLLGWKSSAQTSNKVTWEYRTYAEYATNGFPHTNINELNKMGAEGWELVETRLEETPIPGSNYINRQVRYYFKRMK